MQKPEESKEMMTEVEEKIDFPFDLNTLVNYNFNFSLGFDTLKQSIEYLARQQKKMDSKINDLSDLHLETRDSTVGDSLDISRSIALPQTPSHNKSKD